MRFKRQLWRQGLLIPTGVVIFLILLIARADSGLIVEDGDCLGCHEGLEQSLSRGPHRLASTITEPANDIACISCHSDFENHIDDPSEDNISNPADLSGPEAARVCRQCHAGHVYLDDYGFNAHSEMEMNCSSCHKIHGISRSLLLDEKAGFCIACHKDKTTAFIGVSNHPVMAGTVTCLSCHRFAVRVDDNPAYGLSGACAQCHPEQAGPFLYEHDAAASYAVEGGGCMECHTPHSSQNSFLLKQPGQMLCRQCHMAPLKHDRNSAHGNAWEKYECVVCHTDIHGSFDNSLYLDPDLASRWGINCYQAGCHDVDR